MFYSEMKKEESKFYSTLVLDIDTMTYKLLVYENVYNLKYYQQRKKGIKGYTKDGSVLKPIS